MKNQLITKYIIISFILLLSLSGCNSGTTKNQEDTATFVIDTSLKPFSLTGDLSKVKDSIDKIVLMYISNGKRIKDTCDIKNSNYFFNGKIRDARDASLKALKINKNTDAKNKYVKVNEEWGSIFIAPTEMKIVHGTVFSNVTLTGSPIHLAYAKWKEALKPLNDSMNKFQWEHMNANKAFNLSKKKEDSVLVKKYFMKANKSMDQYFDFIMQYAKNNSKSPILMTILNSFPPAFVKNSETFENEKERLFNQAPISLQHTEKGEQIAQQLAVRLGKQGPDFSLPDMNGNTVKLSSTRGKYVLVEFWANWCAPCRAESPHLVKAFAEFNKDFTIFSVSTDRQKDRQKWLNAIEKDGTNLWPQVHDQEELAANLYKVQNLPTNFLLDREGKIIAKNLRGLKLEEKLKELISLH